MKPFCAVAALAITVASHPFVGENADKKFVYHEDGQVSHRLGTAVGTATPFKQLDHNAKAKKSVYEQASEFVFGKSQEQQLFEENVQKAFGLEDKNVSKQTRRPRLKQSNKVYAENQVALDGGKLGLTYVGQIHFEQSAGGLATPDLNCVEDFTVSPPVICGMVDAPSQNVFVDVIFDTGSDWLAVEGIDCTNCDDVTGALEPDLTKQSAPYAQSDRKYGDLILTGRTFKDKVCFGDPNSEYNKYCVPEFEFFVIDSQKVGYEMVSGMPEPVDGILGMSRAVQTSGYERGPLFTEELVLNGIMQHNAYAFYLADVSGSNSYSFIDFNGYVLNNLKGGEAYDDSIAWIPMESGSFFWQSKVQAVGFGLMDTQEGSTTGDIPESFAFLGNRDYLAIFNTGTSFTLIPGELWVGFTDRIIRMAGLTKYEIIGGFLAFECEKKWDMVNLWFMMDNYWLQMHYLDFVFDASKSGNNSVCAISVVANSQDFFLFGTSFMRGYYTIHDDRQSFGEPGYLGIIPHKTSQKDYVKEAIGMPTQILLPITEESMWTWAIETTAASGWVVFTGFWMNDALEKTIDSTAMVTLVEGGLTGAWGAGCVAMKPVLNRFFNAKPEVLSLEHGSVGLWRIFLSCAALGAAGHHFILKNSSSTQKNKKKAAKKASKSKMSEGDELHAKLSALLNKDTPSVDVATNELI